MNKHRNVKEVVMNKKKTALICACILIVGIIGFTVILPVRDSGKTPDYKHKSSNVGKYIHERTHDVVSRIQKQRELIGSWEDKQWYRVRSMLSNPQTKGDFNPAKGHTIEEMKGKARRRYVDQKIKNMKYSIRKDMEDFSLCIDKDMIDLESCYRELQNIEYELSELQANYSAAEDIEQEVSKMQQRVFPKIRDKFGYAFRDWGWEKDLTGRTVGKDYRTLQIGGAMLAANANKKRLYEEKIRPWACAFRIKRVEMSWLDPEDRGEYTYFEPNVPDDKQVVPQDCDL
jgi:hypothetical protein